MRGRIIAHYRILEKLGSGAMGVVYKAKDIRLGWQLALKFLPDESPRDRVALERFHDEVARLRHQARSYRQIAKGLGLGMGTVVRTLQERAKSS